MNNKGIGAIFCLISAVLMSARYIAAAIFMSNVVSWDSSLFQAGLSYVGSPLKVAAIIALIAGICFLVYGVVRDLKSRINEATNSRLRRCREGRKSRPLERKVAERSEVG